jgi:RNA polymerase sigma-70 factor (ECF subfamily)
MHGPPDRGSATDEELAAWSASGDRRAFDELVVRHGPRALRVAARLVGDAAMAEDMVQEAFVRCWSQIHRFDARRARFTTWLYRIVVNLCIDLKRRKEPQPLPENIDLIDSAASAHEMMESNERDTVLAQALKELPARQRAALMLVYDEGLSGAEAAHVLGSSAKAIERLLARARTYLRVRLLSRQPSESQRC